MALTSSRAHTGKTIQGTRKARALCIRASALGKHDVNRRDAMLLAGSSLLLSPLALSGPALAEEQRYLAVDKLGSFQKSDQRAEFELRVSQVLREILTADDAPACMRLVFNSAATFDAATKTGGMDGSIILSLDRPENASLKPLVERLKAGKAAIDEVNAKLMMSPISWADMIVAAGKVSTRKSWDKVKVARASTTSGGEVIASAFNSPWPITFGRRDSDVEVPAGRLPPRDADAETIKKFMANLGAKPGQAEDTSPFAPKPPFWARPAFVMWCAAADDPAAEEARLAAADKDFAQWKAEYDRSRGTVTRTNYEVDFATYYSKLTSLGATLDSNMYLYPIPIKALKL